MCFIEPETAADIAKTIGGTIGIGTNEQLFPCLIKCQNDETDDA
jgi:hypothetical protein